jgi:hypothetical protein
MGWARFGGLATRPDGSQLVWTFAEGTRGTRWREAVHRDGTLRRSLLLEVTPDGWLTRLEAATTAGLLTLHPQGDLSAMHGNVVTPIGVRHLAYAWSASLHLAFDGSPATAAVLLRRVAGHVAVGDSIEVDGLHVDDALEPAASRWRIERVAVDSWRLRPTSGGGATLEIGLTPDGVPVHADGETWALED